MSFLDKLSKIEALINRASSDGERQAAQLAKERILDKIISDQVNKPIEYRVSFNSPWEKRLFLALCHKHSFHTYRYQRQKHTTACVRVSKPMMDEVLWPEYLRYSKMLRELVEEITQDLINKIHKVDEEEMVVAGEIDFKET
jgi:hypothetical protein